MIVPTVETVITKASMGMQTIKGVLAGVKIRSGDSSFNYCWLSFRGNFILFLVQFTSQCSGDFKSSAGAFLYM